jgi:exonuclease SbcC
VSATAELADLESRIVGVRAELAVATGRATGRPQAEIRIHQLDQALDAANSRAVALARVAALQSQVARATGVEQAAADRVDAVRDAWRAGLAGRLAAHLVDGQACPTCGSDQHPAPAVSNGHAPTDEDLQGAEDEHRRRATDRQSLLVDLAGAQAAAEILTGHDDIADLTDQLSTARTLLDTIRFAEADAARLLRQLESQTQELDRRRQKVTSADATIRAERAVLAERTLNWQGDRDAFIAAHGELTSTSAMARDRRRLADGLTGFAASLQLAESSAAAVAQALETLEPTLLEFGIACPDQLDAWARPVDQIEREMLLLNQRDQERRMVEARIRHYDDGGGPATRPDPAPLAESLQRAADQLDDLVGRLAVVTGRIGSIDGARDELALRSDDVEGARRAMEESEALATACAGQGSGTLGTKVSLEHWVLAYYLRQVLAQANLRLDTMTGGRYALELNREYTDGRKPWGLDLSVLDAETGQSRPATTLSGGETFMAALSLALGLADVVSAGSNYAIGALFVDEGFGSLDGESLDTVVDVLRSLRDGGRMVGVISHVQELNHALPNGITLESTNQGSRAVIHYPDL